MIYFDNSTLTKPSAASVQEFTQALQDYWGVSPSAFNQKGIDTAHRFQEKLALLYRLLGAHHEEHFILTNSSKENVFQVIYHVYKQIVLKTGKNHIITSNGSEIIPSLVLSQFKDEGCVEKIAKVNRQGIVSIDEFAAAMTPRTSLAILSAGNSLTGVIQPMDEIAALCHERAVVLAVDVSNMVGRLPISCSEYPADIIMINGDLCHAPKGVGFVLFKQTPFLESSYFSLKDGLTRASVEKSLRLSQFSYPAFAAFLTAIKESVEMQDAFMMEILRLKAKFEQDIVEAIPHAIILHGDLERFPHISAIAFPGVFNEALLYELHLRGLAASIGGILHASLSVILEGEGAIPEIFQSAISFSFSKDVTEKQIEDATQIIVQAVSKLRRVSSFFLGNERS